MRIKSLLFAAATIVTACAGNAQQPGYTVDVNFGQSAPEGAAAYLLDYDTGEAIDSCRVAGGVAAFKGDIDTPRFVRLTLGGERVASFILEPAAITVGNDGIKGGELNGRLMQMNDDIEKIENEFADLPATATDEQRQAIIDRYHTVLDSAMKANIDNPIGYYLFIQSAMEMTPDELDALVAAHPQMKQYKRVQSILESQQNKAATSVGHKYKDFAITYDGKTERLSDYVKPGEYTLVDFWASWCGPCIRQTAVLKQLYNRYHDKGLNVVGVAVWDEPQNTLEAIKEHDLPWPCILNAQTIPTDLYGIQGIPCIILIGPDGTILSRDKQDNELIHDVEQALANR